MKVGVRKKSFSSSNKALMLAPVRQIQTAKEEYRRFHCEMKFRQASSNLKPRLLLPCAVKSEIHHHGVKRGDSQSLTISPPQWLRLQLSGGQYQATQFFVPNITHSTFLSSTPIPDNLDTPVPLVQPTYHLP
jgi:hypothetical protein